MGKNEPKWAQTLHPKSKSANMENFYTVGLSIKNMTKTA